MRHSVVETLERSNIMTHRVLTSREGHVLVIRLNRADKRNAADMQMLEELAQAYGELNADPTLRVGLVTADGDHFTGGLDLADIAPRLTAAGLNMVPDGAIDPWGVQTSPVSKPVVVAVKGTCFTLGIELILAADIAVAADTTTFAQLEVQRGILPFGGATLRFASRCGWGNAMRWMLTGDTFTADQAAGMGLVQEVVDVANVEARALEIAQRIASAAPLAVSATLRNARLAARASEEAAISQLQPELVALMQSHDARLAFESYLTKVPPVFEGR
jgi:enoyl-CoA hydratase/carnithine racemase